MELTDEDETGGEIEKQDVWLVRESEPFVYLVINVFL